MPKPDYPWLYIGNWFIYGAFLGYLSSALQIFQTTFEVGDLFAVYFAVASLSIGVASYLNSHLVQKYGMRLLTRLSIALFTVLSIDFSILLWLGTPSPPLLVFMVWLLAVFFCIGILFGNLNALAMEPLGHIAGLGSAFVGSLSTFISLPLGWAIGHLFNGTVSPLALGFAILGFSALAVTEWVARCNPLKLNK